MLENGRINFGTCFKSGDKEIFFLDHQCDEWVIGNIEDAKKLVAELQKTIQEVEARKV